MDKKELILTVAKDILIASGCKIVPPAIDKTYKELNDRFSRIIKMVEKVYSDIKD